MSAVKPLVHLMQLNASKFTKTEITLLEVEIFTRVCEELKKIFKERYASYYRLINFTCKIGDSMIENKFLQLIIEDILTTNDYNLLGIAYYTDTPVEVIEEVMTGRHLRPSAIFLRKLIELHRMAKPSLYNMLIKKISDQYLDTSK